MADVAAGMDGNRLPKEIRERLALLELELSEGDLRIRLLVQLSNLRHVISTLVKLNHR